jgi:formylglycine-generating enzyme
MLTRVSRSRSGVVGFALLAAACELDRRALVSVAPPEPAGSGGEPDEGAGARAGAGPEANDAGSRNAAATCGDGVLEGDEQCDDGGRVELDGCNHACQIETGYACSGEPASCRRCSGAAGERRCAISGGPFERGPAADPTPAEVSAFQLDELEVTVARFRNYVSRYSGAPKPGAGAHPDLEHSGWRAAWAPLLPTDRARLIQSLHCNADWETWTDAPGDREDYPLTCASYFVAFAFCASSGGRLPTEVEWEYAARGGAQQRAYPWGDAEPSLELALFGASAIAPAGGHRPGMARFGQLDLAGSVWEWTLDLYRPYPATCDRCAELENGLERVLRGGAFLYDAEYLHSSYRYHLDPQLALGDVGFRCAYDSP